MVRDRVNNVIRGRHILTHMDNKVIGCKYIGTERVNHVIGGKHILSERQNKLFITA